MTTAANLKRTEDEGLEIMSGPRPERTTAKAIPGSRSGGAYVSIAYQPLSVHLHRDAQRIRACGATTPGLDGVGTGFRNTMLDQRRHTVP